MTTATTTTTTTKKRWSKKYNREDNILHPEGAAAAIEQAIEQPSWIIIDSPSSSSSNSKASPLPLKRHQTSSDSTIHLYSPLVWEMDLSSPSSGIIKPEKAL